MTLEENIELLENIIKEKKVIDFDFFLKKFQNRFIFQYSDFIMGSVYRSTVLNKKELYHSITKDRFSYPNPKKGIKVTTGRVNVENFPVLYCSNTLAGAVAENYLSNTQSKKNNTSKIFFF